MRAREELPPKNGDYSPQRTGILFRGKNKKKQFGIGGLLAQIPVLEGVEIARGRCGGNVGERGVCPSWVGAFLRQMK